MRAVTVAFLSLALAGPAMAQQGGGISDTLRNLNNALGGGTQTQDRERSTPDRDRNAADRDRGISGSSAEPSRLTFRSDEDMRREQRRLDDLQTQINDAQRHVDEEWGKFERAKREYQRR